MTSAPPELERGIMDDLTTYTPPPGSAPPTHFDRRAWAKLTGYLGEFVRPELLDSTENLPTDAGGKTLHTWLEGTLVVMVV